MGGTERLLALLRDRLAAPPPELAGGPPRGGTGARAKEGGVGDEAFVGRGGGGGGGGGAGGDMGCSRGFGSTPYGVEGGVDRRVVVGGGGGGRGAGTRLSNTTREILEREHAQIPKQTWAAEKENVSHTRGFGGQGGGGWADGGGEGMRAGGVIETRPVPAKGGVDAEKRDLQVKLDAVHISLP